MRTRLRRNPLRGPKTALVTGPYRNPREEVFRAQRLVRFYRHFGRIAPSDAATESCFSIRGNRENEIASFQGLRH
jgi:hypothetical protein